MLYAAEDAGDLSEYIRDRRWRESEMMLAPTPGFMETVQKDTNARTREILVDWLVELHLKLKLHADVIYITVQLLDRFLSLKSVHRTKLTLVGCTAMMLACKYDEDKMEPQIGDFIYMTANAFDKSQFITMESIMLATLQFRLTRPSILNFVQLYNKVSHANETTTMLSEYLCELTLQKMDLIFERPSMVAAGAVYLSRMLTGQVPWTDVLNVRSGGYLVSDVVHCARIIHKMHMESDSKYRAVRRKYTSKAYSEVARINAGDIVF
jgi:cyclin B